MANNPFKDVETVTREVQKEKIIQ